MWVPICVMDICLREIKLVMLSKHKWKLKLLINLVFIFHVIWLNWFNGAEKEEFLSFSTERRDLLYISFLIKEQQKTCFNVYWSVQRHIFLEMVNWVLALFLFILHSYYFFLRNNAHNKWLLCTFSNEIIDIFLLDQR